jgi:3-methyladenine DNA glycosylase AlkD
MKNSLIDLNELLSLDSSHKLKYDISNRKPYYGISYQNLYLIAKNIKNKEEFIKNNDLSIYELEIIQTYLIGKIKDIDQALFYFDQALNTFKEWSTIDSLSQKFVIAKKYPSKVFKVLISYSKIDSEYIQRLVSVMLLSHFMNDDYIDQSIELIKTLNHHGYYTKMAIAWFYQVLYVKYKEKCLNILNNQKLDQFIFKKAISKMIDSKKINQLDKENLKKLRLKYEE